MSDSSETFEIELTAMAHGGSALGRHDKRIVFIPYTIPGEVVEARITTDKGRIAFAEGLRLVDASTDRVFPRCKHFGPGRCGRCQWQHIDYPAQLLLKQDVLADQLSRVGKLSDDVIDAAMQPVIGSPSQWHYNHRMTLTATADGQLGFPKAGIDPVDGELTIIDECEIMHPELLELLQTLELDFSGLKRLTVQIGSDGEKLLVMHVDNEDDAPELHADFSASVNLLLPDDEPVNLIGDTHTRFTILRRTFRATAGSAFRGNLGAVELLVKQVVNALELTGSEAVLDLYGGVGLFSAFIAPGASLVTVVESHPPSATDADENLADFDHVGVIEGPVEDVLVDGLDEDYDVAVLDPPPGGLSVEAMDALAALRLPRLVYVASDPATLARDASRLMTHGYTLERIQPVDLHPQTYYTDAVAVFTLA